MSSSPGDRIHVHLTGFWSFVLRTDVSAVSFCSEEARKVPPPSSAPGRKSVQINPLLFLSGATELNTGSRNCAANGAVCFISLLGLFSLPTGARGNTALESLESSSPPPASSPHNRPDRQDLPAEGFLPCRAPALRQVAGGTEDCCSACPRQSPLSVATGQLAGQSPTSCTALGRFPRGLLGGDLRGGFLNLLQAGCPVCRLASLYVPCLASRAPSLGQLTYLVCAAAEAEVKGCGP